MTLPQFTKTHAAKKLTEYCDKKVPDHIRNELRLTFEFRGNNVTLIEERAPWREDMTEWTRMPIAQLRYNEKKNQWKLYCADRNDKWHWYQKFEAGIENCLAEIDRDSTGIFYG